MKFKNQALSLQSDALPADTLLVQKLHGRERMSGLFRFELDLLCEDADLDLEAVLYAPAKLGIRVSVPLAGGQVGHTMREVSGVFESFEHRERRQGWVQYRAVLVPKMWQATRSFQSRVFQEKTLDQLVTDVLKSNELDASHDFEFQLQREGADEAPTERAVYPQREYIVQYEESDWDFLARWLEHEGVYFYFQNEDGEEKVVFADTESSYAKPMFGESVPYHPEATGGGADSDKFVEEEIRTFRCRQGRLPKQVRVTDYNWRIPGRIHHTEDVRENGTGVQAQYNDHFKDEKEAKALAQVRAEELAGLATTYYGTSSCRSFRPGSTFTLAEHFRTDWNRSYVLLSVVHEAEQMISTESATVTGVKYENTFEAMPDNCAWRPPRTTAWPSIKGVVNATIDAEGDGHYAELDEHGRYKVVMQYDLHADTPTDGKSSRWIRMAQPYAGQNAGMHFPLHKGTEVLITHIDGDPDRPIISGAVPNPETESPTTGVDPTTNAIRTAAGNVLQMDDDDAYSGFLMMDALRSIVSDSRQRRKVSPPGPSTSGQPASGSGNASPTDRTPPDAERAPRAPAAGATPTSGNGNYTAAKTKKERDLVDSWNAFFDSTVKDETGAELADKNGDPIPTAFNELSTHGTLFQDQLKNRNKGPTLTDAVGVSFNKSGGSIPLTEANVVTALNYALGKGNQGPISDYSVGGIRGTSATNTATGKLGELLKNQANDLLASAKGTRIKLFLDDNVTFSLGDSYTYADGTNSVSIGTGGNSYSETLAGSNSVSVSHGTQVSESTSHGNSESTSTTHGDSTSKSTTHGNSTSESWTFGDSSSKSYTFNAQDAVSLTVSARTSNSIDLGVFNSNSLFIGAKGGLEICVAPKIEMEIAVTVGKFEILSAKGTFSTTQDSFFMRQSEIDMQKSRASLNETAARLMGVEGEVSKNRNYVSEVANKVNSNENLLNTINMGLNYNQNLLTAQKNGMAMNQTVMTENQVAMMQTLQGILTKLG